MVWTELTVVQQLEFCGLVRPLFPDGDRMRKTIATLKKGFYLLLTEMIAVYLIAFPVHAFQVSSSSTGYVRVATASAISAYQVAQRAAFTGALASAISAPTVASVAVRLATGPVGWGLLGVSAALTLASMYYSAQEVQAVKTAALACRTSRGDAVTAVGPLPAGAIGISATAFIPDAFNASTVFYVCRTRDPSTSLYRAIGRTSYASGPGQDGTVAIQIPGRPRAGETGSTRPTTGPTHRVNRRSAFAPPSSLTLAQVSNLCRTVCLLANPNSIESKRTRSVSGCHGSCGGERHHDSRCHRPKWCPQ